MANDWLDDTRIKARGDFNGMLFREIEKRYGIKPSEFIRLPKFHQRQLMLEVHKAVAPYSPGDEEERLHFSRKRYADDVMREGIGALGDRMAQQYQGN